MVINHNISALNTYNQLSKNEKATQSSLSKLSSGLRINSAADDAAGLAISQKMQAQINGLDQASSNAQDGISMLQTAEGALSETQSILQRMNTLAVQASNDTETDEDRSKIQDEVDQLSTEITRISNDTTFNSQTLLNGGITDNKLQIGADAGQTMDFSIGAMDAKTLGVARDATTVTGTTAGDVDTATFANSTGAAIVDGANITFTYAAGSTTPAAAASYTSASTPSGTDLSSITDGSLSITIDGNVVTLDTTALQAGTSTSNLAGAINTAISSYGTATVNGDGNIVIASNTTGSSSSVSLTVSGTDAATVEGALGMSGATASVTGTNATTTADHVTIADGAGGHSQVVDVDSGATSLSVTSGDFAGMSITTDSGKTVADLGTGDTVTLAVSTTAAAAATFNGDGTLNSAAVAAAGLDVSTQGAAEDAITAINTAISTVSSQRSRLGAYENRLDHTINNLSTESENLTSAESAITDVDMAKEMTNYTKNNILNSAAQAMLAQANQLPQGILQLLK